MTHAEWIEAALIAVAAPATAVAWPYLPIDTNGSRLVLGGAVLLLAQSLIRDVTILLRRRGANAAPARTASCMCLESTIGIVGVAVGLGAAGFADFGPVSLSRLGFSFIVAGTLVFGLAIKDWVIAWKPWGLRREKDHLNLIVRWK